MEIERNDNHEYRIDGREIPYVSMILEVTGIKKKCDFIKPHYLTRGTYFHQAIDYDIEGKLDYDSLDNSLKPFIDGFRDFRKSTGIIFSNETKQDRKIYHKPPYEYCGEYDCKGQIPGHKRQALIEWKSGYRQTWHKYQNGLYCLDTDYESVIVWFAKDGTWKWKYYTAIEQLQIAQECRKILEKFYSEFMNADLFGNKIKYQHLKGGMK